MNDKQKMPADGGGRNIGKPDGVSGAPDSGETHGRVGGGESSGGAYPNPHTGKKRANSGFMGHGGQSLIDYHGGDNPNAPTGRADGDGEGRAGTAPSAERQPHEVSTGDRVFSIVEESGVAAAEATGKIATDAPYERNQEQPGSG